MKKKKKSVYKQFQWLALAVKENPAQNSTCRSARLMSAALKRGEEEEEDEE